MGGWVGLKNGWMGGFKEWVVGGRADGTTRGVYGFRQRLRNQITFLQKRANFCPVKGLKKSRKNKKSKFHKRIRKDSYSKTGVQKR
jgi:hypothetical protein